MPRFLCLYWSNFPAWVAQHNEPALRGRPVVVHQGGRIIAASPEAEQVGAQAGWTLHRTQAQLPDAICRPLHGPTMQAVWSELLSALLDFTPYLESLRPGWLMADVRPARAVLPLVRQWQAQGGVADDRATSELAAFTTAPGVLRSVRAGQSPTFLRRVPLSVLAAAGLRDDSLERLGWFGWQHTGDLTQLTQRQLLAQFDQGKLLYRYAHAADQRPVTFYRQPPTVTATFSFDMPARQPYEWEPVLGFMIEQAVTGLKERGAQTVSLSITTPQGIRRGHRLLPVLTTEKRPLYEAARRLVRQLMAPGANEPNSKVMPLQGLTLQLGALHALPPLQESMFGRKRPPLQVAVRAVDERFPGALQRIVLLDKNAYLPETAFRLEPVTGETITENIEKGREGVNAKRKRILREKAERLAAGKPAITTSAQLPVTQTPSTVGAAPVPLELTF
jgi:nucleotidyltransferase/DNA polymerase involved in DNA repair